jgi:hypothetical protein
VDFQRWGGSNRLCDVVEPIAEVCNHEGILIPRGVVKRSCYSATLQVTNVTGSERVLPKGLTLAYLEPADLAFNRPETSASVTVVSTNSEPIPELPEHLKSLVDNNEELSETQREAVSRLLLQYCHCFEGGEYGLGQTSLVKHKIDTGDHVPVKIPPRRLGWAQRRALNEEVEKMLAKEIIEPSDSPWSSPPVLVRKKDSSFRFCVDYRKVNSLTKRDAYPLPRIDDCLDCLAGAQWFCTLDLSSGYWQIAMEDADKAKTAFTAPRGHYQFRVMPFGEVDGVSVKRHEF